MIREMEEGVWRFASFVPLFKSHKMSEHKFLAWKGKKFLLSITIRGGSNLAFGFIFDISSFNFSSSFMTYTMPSLKYSFRKYQFALIMIDNRHLLLYSLACISLLFFLFLLGRKNLINKIWGKTNKRNGTEWQKGRRRRRKMYVHEAMIWVEYDEAKWKKYFSPFIVVVASRLFYDKKNWIPLLFLSRKELFPWKLLRMLKICEIINWIIKNYFKWETQLFAQIKNISAS